eukprot:TRINITY_DN15903_c0_g1_i1.p1 TRINITY_DN15903_c0_g1~~TRINITY_DN15903_c0_g1_i1.p1  ORF type:complete len:229 (-),score=19.87 TRINITY_DN15903_c0_g1_i1:37-723(-)
MTNDGVTNEKAFFNIVLVVSLIIYLLLSIGFTVYTIFLCKKDAAEKTSARRLTIYIIIMAIVYLGQITDIVFTLGENQLLLLHSCVDVAWQIGISYFLLIMLQKVKMVLVVNREKKLHICLWIIFVFSLVVVLVKGIVTILPQLNVFPNDFVWLDPAIICVQNSCGCIIVLISVVMLFKHEQAKYQKKLLYHLIVCGYFVLLAVLPLTQAVLINICLLYTSPSPRDRG